MLRALVDSLVYTSLWAAAVAAALCAAAALAMGIPVVPAAVGVAFTGTLVVYNVDRLRDLERDFATTPDRSAFIAIHSSAILGLTGAAALGSAAFALAIGPRVGLLLAPVLGVGLLHRRLKRIPVLKPVYIAIAWLTVVVGLPVAIDPRAERVGAVGAVYALAILANLVASNVRDRETATDWVTPRRGLAVARGLAVLGTGVALAGAPEVRSLVPIPLATGLALLRPEMSERYGLVVVDGALLAGSAVSLLLLRMP